MIYDAPKYASPYTIGPVYRITPDNPILDPDRQWSLQECRDRLGALQTALEGLEAQAEREVVEEEIHRLKGLLEPWAPKATSSSGSPV
jgi:hypothetical protein